MDVVAESFGIDFGEWGSGRRQDGAARAVAAYLDRRTLGSYIGARRTLGYRATEVAKALGYASHGGVVAAIHRVETAPRSLRTRADRLGREPTPNSV